MQDQDPTVRSRELGRLLSEALATVGMSQIALARELGWSPSTVSRMISGKRPVSAEQMSGVLGVLRITGERRRYAMSIARRAAEPGWLRELGDHQPARNEARGGEDPGDWGRGCENPEDDITVSGDTPTHEIPGRETLRALEDSAATIVVFEQNCVPDVLRTAEYITALLRADPAVSAEKIDAGVQARVMRHGAFLDRKEPANLLFFIDEYALGRTGAGREIMSIQVHHVLRMSVRPNITIRVIPETAGFHAGTKGGFRFVEFTDGNSAVCIENEASIVFLECEETLAIYRDIAEELSRVALGEAQTHTWLSTLAAQLGTQRDDIDSAGSVGIAESDDEQDEK